MINNLSSLAFKGKCTLSGTKSIDTTPALDDIIIDGMTQQLVKKIGHSNLTEDQFTLQQGQYGVKIEDPEKPQIIFHISEIREKSDTDSLNADKKPDLKGLNISIDTGKENITINTVESKIEKSKVESLFKAVNNAVSFAMIRYLGVGL